MWFLYLNLIDIFILRLKVTVLIVAAEALRTCKLISISACYPTSDVVFFFLAS